MKKVSFESVNEKGDLRIKIQKSHSKLKMGFVSFWQYYYMGFCIKGLYTENNGSVNSNVYLRLLHVYTRVGG